MFSLRNWFAVNIASTADCVKHPRYTVRNCNNSREEKENQME